MTATGPARSAVLGAAALVCTLFSAGEAAAQPEPGTVLLRAGPDAAGGAALAFDPGAPVERDLVARALREPPALDPARVLAVSRVDALLTEASIHGAELREVEALASLAEAARQCEQLADVAGATAWCAESQRRLGLTAAQAGLDELSASAFRRAVALEPARALLPAEAPPQLVARYETVRAAFASAPEGELRVRADVSGAQVFLDDVPQGVAPLSIRAKLGRHALRVEASGHRPYGAFVDVLVGGERPEIAVVLSELPRVEAARAAKDAASLREYARLPVLIAALSPLAVTDALIVEGSASGRMLVVRCDAARCAGPQRIEAGPAVAHDAARLAQPLDWAALRDARRWLSTSPERRRDAAAPWWARWYTWGAAAVVAGAGAALAIALQPEPRRELRVIVEPATP
jgi:hypothetical protein